MAKKITISELLIKIQADTKAATKAIKEIDRLTAQVGKKQVKQKEKQERQEKQNDKEAATRLRHQERMQLAAHRAKLKQEDVLLRERLRNGERIRRQELANHRKAEREQKQREKAARQEEARRNRSNNNNRGRYGGGSGGGTSITNIAAGTALGEGLTGAIAALAAAATQLFNVVKETTKTKEQIATGLYANYVKQGQTKEEALASTGRDMDYITKLSNEIGVGTGNVGQSYQNFMAYKGTTPEQAMKRTENLMRELVGGGYGEQAIAAYVKQAGSLMMGGDIDASDYDVMKDWGLEKVLAAQFGKTVAEMDKLAKSGDMGKVSQTYTPEKLDANLLKNGNADIIKGVPSLNPMTRADQEFNSAFTKLKDTFAKHASGGVADSLNSLAETLDQEEVKNAIVVAGELFGTAVAFLAEGVGFVSELFMGVYEYLEPVLKPAFDILVEILDIFTGTLQALAPAIQPVIDVFLSLKDGIASFLNWLLEIIRGVKKKFMPWLSDEDDKEDKKFTSDDKKDGKKEGELPKSVRYFKLQQDLMKRYEAAKTDEEKQQIISEYPKDFRKHMGTRVNKMNSVINSKELNELAAHLKKAESLPSPKAPTSDSSTNNLHQDNLVEKKKQNTAVDGLQDNIKASSALAEPIAAVAAPTSNTTTTNSSNINNNSNNVATINNTFHGNVTPEFAEARMKEVMERHMTFHHGKAAGPFFTS